MWHSFFLFFADILGKLRPVSAIIVRKGNEFLIVKKNRKEYAWQFVQGGRDFNETFLQAAKRELGEECGRDLKVVFQTLTPFYTYRYFFPKGSHRPLSQENYIGASVRLFHAEYVSGEIILNAKELEDFIWVKKENLEESVEKQYWKVMKSFL